MLPSSLAADLRTQPERSRAVHQKDLTAGFGRVTLPYALAAKYPRHQPSGPGNTSSPRTIVCST